MTFEETEVGEYKSNPYTQDVSKAKDNKTFQQSPLLRIDHEDPGLHYIGETLPKPGETEATWAGRQTSVGRSPIPARADHSHDSFLRFVSTGSGVPVSCPPGQTLITQQYGRGDNFLVTGSLFKLPTTGNWFVSMSLTIFRSGGGIFTGESNIVYYYLNGTYGRGVYRTSNAGLPLQRYINVSDFVHYTQYEIDNNTATVEIAYQHNDVVNHDVYVDQGTIIRLGEIDD